MAEKNEDLKILCTLLNWLYHENKAGIITIFDFFTLHNGIPHNKLLKVMYELNNLFLNVGGNAYITITSTKLCEFQTHLPNLFHLIGKSFKK